ncbi:MAG: DUF6285 domain-containing protein [Myxococcota bacterium]
MQDRPDRETLLQAVRDLLKGSVIPAIEDPALRFRVLVAVNVLGVVRRELRAEDAHWAEEIARLADLLGDDAPDPAICGAEARRDALEAAHARLVQRLEAGDVDEDAATAHVRRTLAEKLSVVNPRFDLSTRIE